MSLSGGKCHAQPNRQRSQALQVRVNGEATMKEPISQTEREPQSINRRLDRIMRLLEQLRETRGHKDARVAVALRKTGVVPDRVVRMPEVCQIVGLSESMIFGLCAEGDFPARIRLTPRTVGWRLSDVMAWIDSRERVTS
jgi:prophage regulatory protein